MDSLIDLPEIFSQILDYAACANLRLVCKAWDNIITPTLQFNVNHQYCKFRTIEDIYDNPLIKKIIASLPRLPEEQYRKDKVNRIVDHWAPELWDDDIDNEFEGFTDNDVFESYPNLEYLDVDIHSLTVNRNIYVNSLTEIYARFLTPISSTITTFSISLPNCKVCDIVVPDFPKVVLYIPKVEVLKLDYSSDTEVIILGNEKYK